MCESKIYWIDAVGNHLVMENVTQVQDENGVYLLTSLLGEQKLVRGRIVRVDFMNHAIYLEHV